MTPTPGMYLILYFLYAFIQAIVTVRVWAGHLDSDTDLIGMVIATAIIAPVVTLIWILQFIFNTILFLVKVGR